MAQRMMMMTMITLSSLLSSGSATMVALKTKLLKSLYALMVMSCVWYPLFS